MIAIYALLMVAIGLYCSRYAKIGINYFAGGRKIPWWLSGISSWMGAFSAYVFVGLASKIYQVGLATLFHVLYAMSFAWLVGSVVWAARWRMTGIITVPEYMEKRFNLTARQVFAWIVTPFRIADDGVKCYSTALIMAFVFGIPAWQSIVGLSLITIAYTMVGGLWAVMITDMVQFVILVLVVIVVVPVGLAKIGWLGGLVEGAPEHFFSLFHSGTAFNDEFTVWYFVTMWLMHPFLYNGSFTLVQRYTTVPTARDARKSAQMSMWLGYIFFPLLVLPPMISRVLYGDTLMASTTLMETSYIKLCVDLLPVGMIGVVVVAIMAATMSALSADYNVYGAVLTNDLYNRLIDRKASQRRLAIVGRFSTLLVGALALLVALLVESFGGAFDVMMTILGLIAGPTTIPILLGLWVRKPPAAGAIAAVVAGVAFGAAAKWMWGFNYAAFVLGNMSVTTLVFLAWGWFSPVAGKAREQVDLLFDSELRTVERQQPGEAETISEDDQKAPSPFAISGVILGAIGIALGTVGLFTGAMRSVMIDSVIAVVLIVVGVLMIRFGRILAKR
jgi:SSS family transporter